MRRFFIGGAPEINDVSYVALPKDFKVYITKQSVTMYIVRTHSLGILSIEFFWVFEKLMIYR